MPDMTEVSSPALFDSRSEFRGLGVSKASWRDEMMDEFIPFQEEKRKMEEKERKKAEVRKRLEEASKAKKGGGEKKGFMTPERKKKLRVSESRRGKIRFVSEFPWKLLKQSSENDLY